jgi:hypothetical protein
LQAKPYAIKPAYSPQMKKGTDDDEGEEEKEEDVFSNKRPLKKPLPTNIPTTIYTTSPFKVNPILSRNQKDPPISIQTCTPQTPLRPYKHSETRSGNLRQT